MNRQAADLSLVNIFLNMWTDIDYDSIQHRLTLTQRWCYGKEAEESLHHRVEAESLNERMNE